MMKVTDNDIKALRLIAIEPGCALEIKSSSFGFRLYGQGSGVQQRRRRPQGLALSGGKALSRLLKNKLITKSIGDIDRQTSIYKVTDAGHKALVDANPVG